MIKRPHTIQSINVVIILTVLVVDTVLVTAMLVPIPFMKAEQCGVLDLTRIARVGDSYTAMTGNCFGHAFLTCQPATMTFVSSETQARIMTVEKHFMGCNILDTVQRTNGLTRNSTTYICSGMRFSHWGLIIKGCGEDHDVWLLTRSYLR
ncbi:MAG: hypothetical protein NVS2B12_09800 [Ktedonobacteraceae bacterium]